MFALCALGFRLSIEWGDEKEILHILFDENADEAEFISSLGSSCTLILEMFEPDLTSPSGLTDWTSWFDRLKALRASISDYRDSVFQ